MRPPSLRITALVVLAAVGLGGLLTRPAEAADWTVEGAANQFGPGRERFGYTVNPGGEVQDGIVVVNHGAAPLHLALRPADGFALERKSARGVSALVHLDRGDVTVPPGGSSEVPFTVTLPANAAPGDYAGGIVSSSGDRRVAIRMRLRVGGALKPSLAVERVRVHYSQTANPLGSGDATVTYTIRNTGNAILTARQAVSLSGPFGRWEARAPKIATTPPLLPGDTWRVSAPVRGVTPALRLMATVTLVPLLTDAAGSTAPLAATKTSGHAWTVPWSLLVVIVLVCGLVAAAASAYRSFRAPLRTAA
jgi:hypothetical protein